MTNRLQIYLDTSVINFLFADDSPEKKEITIDFFDNFIKTGVYETFISDVVIAEIEDTNDPEKRQALLGIIEQYPIDILDLNAEEETEIEELANNYVEAKVIPEKKFADALHIATSVICKINYLVSWNFRHLANVNKEKKVHIVNLKNNYREDIRLITPLELIDYES
ncbi:MAG: PIN domain-containing protein [Flavobacteriales bacterium]